MSENSSGAPPFRPPVRDCGVRRCGPRPSFARPTDFRHAPAMSPPRAAGCIPAPATNRPRGACPIGFAGTHRLLSRLLRMSENSSGAPPFRSPVRDCGVRRCVPQRNTPAPRPSFARLTDFRHAPAMSPPRAAGHSGSGNEPPVRSLSGRLCRDASSSRPPSPDVGKFIRGAAFPIARAGLRRPLMRSAVECSRPAALFRAPDGLSARPGMSPPRAAGGIPAPATNRPRGACPVGFAGTHRLLSRLLRMSENSSGGTAFPIARAGLRCPQMRSAAECSRPAALFRPSDGLSARPGMSPPRAAGGIPAPATNRPRGACPVGFAGTHRLLSRLLRMSENSSGGTAFPIARAGLRCPQMRPAALFRPSDGFSARPGMSPPRAAGGGHSGSGNEPPAPHSPGGQTPPGAAAATVQLSGSPLPVPMRPVRPKREVRTGAARRFRPNHAVRPPLADVRLFGNGSARNIEGLSNKSRKSGITPVGIHSGRGEIVEIRLVRQPQFAHT